MQSQLSPGEIWNIFWSQAVHQVKFKLFFALALIFLSSFAELLSLGAIIPFLSALADPGKLLGDDRLLWIFKILDIQNKSDLIFSMTIFFIGTVISASAIRLASNYFSIRLSFSISHRVSVAMFKKLIYMPYSKQISGDNSEMIATLTAKLERVVFSLILQSFFLCTSIIISLILLTAFFVISPKATIFTIISCGLFYYLIIKLLNSRLLLESENIANASTIQIKTIRETIGGIRDVLINNAHQFYTQIFEENDYVLRKGQAHNMFVSMSPRFLIEGLGLIIISLIAYFLTQGSNFVGAVPVLGALAIGAQKILPLFQQGYVAWTSLKGNFSSLQDVSLMLSESVTIHSVDPSMRINFQNSISMDGVVFSYDQSKTKTLDNINFTINKGDRLGVIGETGSGKSTFVDIISGLLPPTDGRMYIDKTELTLQNKSLWMNGLAYVPQYIYLSDSSIIENIAIGIKESNINMDLIDIAIKAACLEDFIHNLPDGIHGRVGERGIKISGGQRQRIGIARAIYKQADLIIFDEATSALDSATEERVMDAIYNLDKEITVILIAHRTSTLKNCNKIIKIENKSLSQIK
jgi:ATP-binding cassette, subfamily B, bacterial PglK